MKQGRVPIVIVLFLLITFLGFFRDRYLINLLDWERPLIMERYEAGRIYGDFQDRDKHITFVERSPKWISALVYSAIYLLLGATLIHVYFGNRKYTLYTVWIYLGVIVFSMLLVGGSLLAGAFEFGYLAGQPLKNLVQSPLLAMVLFVWFLVGRRMGG